MDNDIRTGRTAIYYVLTFLLFIILSLGVFFFINRYFGGNTDIYRMFYIKNIALGLLILLTFTAYILADSWRLYYILQAMRYRLPFLYTVKLTLISIFVANITPMAAGGGFIQLYLLHKKGVPIATATAITGLRTFLAILFFIVIFPLAIILLPGSREFLLGEGNRYYFFLVIITYILFIIFVIQVFTHKKEVIRFICRITDKTMTRFHIKGREEKLNRTELALEKLFSDVDRFLFKKKKEFLISMLITSLYLCLFIMIPVVLMYNYSTSIPFYDAFINQVIVVFLTYFGITPGSAGIAELIFVVFNSPFINDEGIISLTFMWRFVSIYLGMILGAGIILGGFCKRKSKIKIKTGRSLS